MEKLTNYPTPIDNALNNLSVATKENNGTEKTKERHVDMGIRTLQQSTDMDNSEIGYFEDIADEAANGNPHAQDLLAKKIGDLKAAAGK